jgi:hypothetical protein
MNNCTLNNQDNQANSSSRNPTLSYRLAVNRSFTPVINKKNYIYFQSSQRTPITPSDLGKVNLTMVDRF